MSVIEGAAVAMNRTVRGSICGKRRGYPITIPSENRTWMMTAKGRKVFCRRAFQRISRK